jgi:hypothetical protein
MKFAGKSAIAAPRSAAPVPDSSGSRRSSTRPSPASAHVNAPNSAGMIV